MAGFYFPTDDLYFNISRGIVKGASFIHKFGAVPAMSVNKTGTIWDINDTLYPWSAFDTANTVHVRAADAEDNTKSVVVVGLDRNYDTLEETVVINTDITTNTTNEFGRVFRAYMADGSNNNVDNITFNTNGSDVARISANNGQTLMAVYTVPRNNTAFLEQFASCAQSASDGTGNMFVRYWGTDVANNAFRIGHTFEVTGAGSPYHYDFKVPIPLPANTDIELRITTRSNNGRYTSAFDMILLKTGLDFVSGDFGPGGFG
jgi:hypothetical protein